MDKIIKLLDDLTSEYRERYQWGDSGAQCMALFAGIRYAIQDKLTLAYEKKPNLSLKDTLEVIENFRDNWPNNPSDCDDTDGSMHINSIYTKLQENLS